MSEVVGRAGFHVEHAKAVGERGAILHEMMRELEEDSIAYWAARNPNIVVADEPLNEAMVNDGEGGFRRCTARREVVEYGDQRVAQVRRKIREDTLNRRTGKKQGGTVTTSLIVSHLPKSMCEEIPDFYPVLHKKTGEPVLDDGEPMRRSRWVARDRDEARRYFEDLVGFLSETVIPGGHDGVLGYDIQHSESTPHVQILADTFAPDPEHPDALRADASRAWFTHRGVTAEDGRAKSGKAKMSEYHHGLKQHLISCGYDVSPDFDEKRHLVGMGKDEYARAMDAQRVVEHRGARVAEDEKKLNDWDSRLRDEQADLRLERERLDEESMTLATREEALGRAEDELPKRRRMAAEDGKAEGLAAAEDIIGTVIDEERKAVVGPAQLQAARLLREAEDEKAQAVRARQRLADMLQAVEAHRPVLFEEFLDTPTSNGVTPRRRFERFVDQRLKDFAAEHDVTDRLILHPGDREAFVADGGTALAAEVAELQRQRQYGD